MIWSLISAGIENADEDIDEMVVCEGFDRGLTWVADWGVEFAEFVFLEKLLELELLRLADAIAACKVLLRNGIFMNYAETWNI